MEIEFNTVADNVIYMSDGDIGLSTQCPRADNSSLIIATKQAGLSQQILCPC